MELDIEKGDILCQVDGIDVATIGEGNDIPATIKYLKELREQKKNDTANNSNVIVTMGRIKDMFPILLAQRGGTQQFNGKYSIAGTKNGAYRYFLSFFVLFCFVLFCVCRIEFVCFFFWDT